VQSHHQGPYKSKARRRKKTKDRCGMTKAEIGMRINKHERRTESQRKQVTYEAEEEREMDVPWTLQKEPAY
jgi:hypothetical protein